MLYDTYAETRKYRLLVIESLMYQDNACEAHIICIKIYSILIQLWNETVRYKASHRKKQTIRTKMDDQPSVDPAVGDVTETIAFGLLNDAEKLGQVWNNCCVFK